MTGWGSILEVFSKLKGCGIPTLCPLGGLALPPHSHSAQMAKEEQETISSLSFFPSFPGSFRAPCRTLALPASENSCEFTPGDSLLKVLPCHNPPTLSQRREKIRNLLGNSAFVTNRELRPWTAVCSFCTFPSSTAAGLGWGCCGQVTFGLQTLGHC